MNNVNCQINLVKRLCPSPIGMYSFLCSKYDYFTKIWMNESEQNLGELIKTTTISITPHFSSYQQINLNRHHQSSSLRSVMNDHSRAKQKRATKARAATK